tara:strand:+ start:148 stop:819 length:672 start_codon:yes stop_codon:yes gene_type:complete
MSTVALIPARGGSKGIPRKNIKNFCSKPLIFWSIKIALESKLIDRVIVSTEDEEIANIAKSFSAEVPFLRPKDLARDNTPGIDPVIHALNLIPEIDDLLLLQPTSPIRNQSDIEGIFRTREEFNSDSSVSITLASKPLCLHHELSSENKLIPISSRNIKIRQDFSNEYVLNGSMYLSKRESILQNKSLITAKTVGYEMSPYYSIDIDTYFDWEIAEFIMKKLK